MSPYLNIWSQVGGTLWGGLGGWPRGGSVSLVAGFELTVSVWFSSALCCVPAVEAVSPELPPAIMPTAISSCPDGLSLWNCKLK